MPKIRLDQQSKNETVTSELVKNLNIKEEDIQDEAITESKLKDNSITSSKIAPKQIKTSHLDINEPLEFNFNELKNFRVEVVDTLPSNLYDGRIVYLKHEQSLYYDTGSEWVLLPKKIIPFKIVETFQVIDTVQRIYNLSIEALDKTVEVYLNGLKLVPEIDFELKNNIEIHLNSELELNINDNLQVEYFDRRVTNYFFRKFEREIFVLNENQKTVILDRNVAPFTETVSLNGLTLIRGVDYILNTNSITFTDSLEILDEFILEVTYLTY